MKHNILKKSLYAAMLAVGAASFTGCTDLTETVYSQLPGDGSYTLQDKDIQAMYGPIMTVCVICTMDGKVIKILAKSVVI